MFFFNWHKIVCICKLDIKKNHLRLRKLDNILTENFARKRQLESTTNEQQLRVAVTGGPLKVVLIPLLSTVCFFLTGTKLFVFAN
jgi:hypothetical protein